LIDAILLSVESTFLKKELLKVNKNLELKVEEKTIELRSILDSQENMILVMDQDKLSSANKTLLDFFGLEVVDDFYKKYHYVSESFIDSNNYFYPMEHKNWIEDINKLDDIKKVVSIKNIKGDDRIFQVNIKTFFFNTTHFVVSFTDITDLKQYTYKLKYQATHDNLTKLFNRQKLNEEFDKEILREERYGHGLSLIMLDIDDFKKINDTYGHDKGDVVLIEISNIILKSIRKTDIAARWGGEEFMVLLPETNLNNSLTIAESIRSNIESFIFSELTKNVTVSIGVASFQNDTYDKDSIIKYVDIALYNAKNDGKNRVVAYE